MPRRDSPTTPASCAAATPAPPVIVPSSAVPPIAAPSIAVPPIAVPPIAAPSIAVPPIAAPSIAAPPIAAPPIAVPPVTAPAGACGSARAVAPTASGPSRTRSGARRGTTRARAARSLLTLAALLGLVGACASAAPTAPASAPGTGLRPASRHADADVAATYVRPADPTRVVRAFEPPPHPWAAGHRGVDLAVAPGQRVLAPQSGVVAFAGAVAGRGVVTVRHDDGLTSSLEPVAPAVAVGTRVARGDLVGTVDGPGHCATPPCLHWGVRTAPERYVDPLALVEGSRPVVLLPPRGRAP